MWRIALWQKDVVCRRKVTKTVSTRPTQNQKDEEKGEAR